MALLNFNKPETNIQRAFGLFDLLRRSGYTKGKLCYTQKYIVIDTVNKKFYSASTADNSTDIPSNYAEVYKLILTTNNI